jgi:hypothetical protein
MRSAWFGDATTPEFDVAGSRNRAKDSRGRKCPAIVGENTAPFKERIIKTDG